MRELYLIERVERTTYGPLRDLAFPQRRKHQRRSPPRHKG